jgi:hypothetical protein
MDRRTALARALNTVPREVDTRFVELSERLLIDIAAAAVRSGTLSARIRAVDKRRSGRIGVRYLTQVQQILFEGRSTDSTGHP